MLPQGIFDDGNSIIPFSVNHPTSLINPSQEMYTSFLKAPSKRTLLSRISH